MSSGFIRERILILSISFLELGEVVNLSSFNFLLSTSGNNIWNPAEMVCWVAEICWRKCYTVRVTFRSHISFRNVCLISSVQNSTPPFNPVLLIVSTWSLHLFQEFQEGNYNVPYLSLHNMSLINSNIILKYNLLIQCVITVYYNGF